MITTNRQPEDWGQFSADVPATTTILDRFLEHAEILTMTGYGMRRQVSVGTPPKAGVK